MVKIDDSAGATHWFLNSVHSVSAFQVCAHIGAKSAAEVIHKLGSAWIVWAGAPLRIVADCGPEFTSQEFSDFCETVGAELHTTAVEAPWQNAPAERRGVYWKAKMHVVITEHAVAGAADMRLASNAVCEAHNRDVTNDGYSPFQWVLG